MRAVYGSGRGGGRGRTKLAALGGGEHVNGRRKAAAPVWSGQDRRAATSGSSGGLAGGMARPGGVKGRTRLRVRATNAPVSTSVTAPMTTRPALLFPRGPAEAVPQIS